VIRYALRGCLQAAAEMDTWTGLCRLVQVIPLVLPYSEAGALCRRRLG
jgi:hypothetical protein